MRYARLAITVLLVAIPSTLVAQLSEDVYRERIRTAQATPTTDNLLQAAEAARLLRDYRQAEEFLQQAAQAVQQAQNGLLANQILLELASGGGVNGAQRALRQARRQRRLAPQAVAGWANGFPVLLVGGELDEMIDRFSPEAEDPRYRCTCYAQWENDPPQPDDPDARADVQAQLARNYARAGRHEDARRALETAMSMPVSDEAVSGVRRRWAQTYAELGDVEHAVEHLEYLLSAPTLVTVHTLETRMTWAPIREEPAFQVLLERHR
jgi:tetratricopeptide (TPR) repeat protein